MKKFLEKFRKFAGFPFVFLLIMILFLGVNLGTAGVSSRKAGSVGSLGDSFELQHYSDTNRSWVIFKVSPPKTVDEKGEEKNMNVRLHNVYLNLGTVYSEEEIVTLDLHYSGSSTIEATSFYSMSGTKPAKIYNELYKGEESAEKNEEYIYDSPYRWISPFGIEKLAADSSYRSMSSAQYFKLFLPKVSSKEQKGNILINEVVFVGEVQGDNGGTGEYVVLPAELDARTSLPYNADKEKKEDVLERAKALIDAQALPYFSESSSYYTYGEEEEKMLLTISEMRQGASYVPGDVYDGDKTYNSLALTLTYFGTMMFGMSPFGLRFFNVLASFGVLVVGFFFARRMFKSDRAGLLFATIYSLCGVSVSLAHMASPVMLGVFFLLSSYAACYRYWAVGMKKPSAVCTIPLLLSALSGALAVLVNGAFVIPLLGVVALFIAGVIKQHRKDRAALDSAIEAYENEKAAGVEKEEGERSECEKQVAKTLAAYRYNTVSASVIFSVALLLGIFILSVVFALPVTYAVDKIYNGVVGDNSNFFKIAYTLFAAGFAGGGQSGFNYFYRIFTGTGERYAVTLGVMNFAATLLGLLGIAFAIYRIVMLIKTKASYEHYVSVVMPLVGMILCLVTAAFAGGAVAFVLLSNLFAFLLISGGGESVVKELGAVDTKGALVAKRTVTGVLIAAYSLLAVCFALLFVFTFSIPLPASFMAKIF